MASSLAISNRARVDRHARRARRDGERERGEAEGERDLLSVAFHLNECDVFRSKRSALARCDEGAPRRREPNLRRSHSRRSRPEGEGELRLAREILADEALPLHLGDAEALVELGEDNLHHEGIARNDGATELDAIDAGEEELLLGTTGA